jgi:hypothetical protein
MKMDPFWLDQTKSINPDEIQHLLNLGFRFGDRGAHTSRTMMLQELSLLLNNTRPDATLKEYYAAIIQLNCLGKPTMSTRKISAERLRELYGLNPSIPLFRVMRYFWYYDQQSQPLLALLTALAREPLLRMSASSILALQPGDEFSRSKMVEILNQNVQKQFSPETLNRVVRNIASSWTQSGHLSGKTYKIRQAAKPTVFVTTFALLSGYFSGYRGESLLSTFWIKILDSPKSQLLDLAFDAKRLGLLELSQGGGILSITFSNILTEAERQLVHGSN